MASARNTSGTTGKCQFHYVAGKKYILSSHFVLQVKSTKIKRLEGGAAKCGSTKSPCLPEGRRSGAVGKKKALFTYLKIEIVFLQHGK